MSTFPGRFEDIDLISADRFDGANLKSTVFFLSHCHSDHMWGLLPPNNELFLERLSEYGIYLYSSPVTTMMLKEWFPDHKANFIGLPMNEPTCLRIPTRNREEKYVNVTPISAGHCPGSVMFLFESKDKHILYTGDFRINTKELNKFKMFHDSSNQIKQIHKMYLDTTFFNKKFINFPTREETLNGICKVIDDWITQSKRHVINFETSAVYGSEYLYLGIFKKFNMPIHVREKTYVIYKYFPEMDKAITLNGDITQIHSSCIDHLKFCTNTSTNSKLIRSIKTSAMCWFNWKDGDPVIRDNKYLCRICYSCHASYDEICEFIEYLKPDSIEASVKPKNAVALDEMNKSLQECIDKYKKPEELIDKSEQIKLFDVNCIDDFRKDDCDEFLDLGMLDSPPMEFKRKRV